MKLSRIALFLGLSTLSTMAAETTHVDAVTPKSYKRTPQQSVTNYLYTHRLKVRGSIAEHYYLKHDIKNLENIVNKKKDYIKNGEKHFKVLHPRESYDRQKEIIIEALKIMEVTSIKLMRDQYGTPTTLLDEGIGYMKNVASLLTIPAIKENEAVANMLVRVNNVIVKAKELSSSENDLNRYGAPQDRYEYTKDSRVIRMSNARDAFGRAMDQYKTIYNLTEY